jgi:hypothetical protein
MDREDTNAKQRGGGILTAEVIRSSRIVDCVFNIWGTAGSTEWAIYFSPYDFSDCQSTGRKLSVGFWLVAVVS